MKAVVDNQTTPLAAFRADVPRMPAVAPPVSNNTLARAHELVLRYGWNTMAYQILNPGIQHWFAPQGDAVIGYVNTCGYRVVAGEPVCAHERLADVAATFEAEVRQAGQRVCYFGAQDRLVMVQDTSRPLAGLLLGAQPVWCPALWAERLAKKSSFRAQLARARNKQVTVTPWDVRRATNHPDLQRCLRAWLQTRRLPPMHFLVEPYILGQLADRRVLVAERAGQVVGFLVASPIPQRNGWLVEQLVRGSGAPNGTTELLIDTAMRHLAASGAAYVTLGLTPLSRRAGFVQTRQPLSTRMVLALVLAYGQRFYNFNGLDTYRAKFLPEWWEPVFAISRERHTSLRTLYAIAGAFGSTSPVLYIGHGLLRAASQELQHTLQQSQHWLAQTFKQI